MAKKVNDRRRGGRLGITQKFVGDVSLETKTVRALNWQCSSTAAIIPPIHVSTTYARDEDYHKPDERGYIRDDNPSFDQAESLLCELEGAYDALLFASGAAACTSLLQVLRAGSHIICQENIYFGIPKWIREHLCYTHDITVEFVDGSVDSLRVACERRCPVMIWVETPANPTLDVIDIVGAVGIARQFSSYLVVDSTVATPVHSRPLSLGADFVVHSATKALNGHSDLLAGFVACREGCDLWDRVVQHRQLTGPLLGSFETYLLLRGMRTLFLRARVQADNALYIARLLERDYGDRLSIVYPGLESHPDHVIACSQMVDGFGSLMAIMMGGDIDFIMGFLSRLRLVKRATSLGGIESLIEHRKTIEGVESLTPDNLLRFSVGIESPDDIVGDIVRALG